MWKFLEKLASQGRFYPIIIILIIFFTGMKLVHINADAPQDLTISAAIYTDEGFKTYSSRNKILFGDWKWTPDDEYSSWTAQSPLSTLTYLWIFKKLGVSFATIRMPSVFYSILTLIALFIFLVRNFNRFTALVGTILMGTNFYTTMFSRLGLYETHLLFYLMLALLGFSEAFKKREGPASGRLPNSIKEYAFRIFFLSLGFIGLASGFFIKRSIFIIAVALAPAMLIYTARRLGRSARFINRLLIAIIACTVLVYFTFAYAAYFKNFIMYHILKSTFLGHSLATFLPIFAFDQVPSIIGKGLYLEFIFLHPFTFLFAIFISLMHLYDYIHHDRPAMNLFLSSWLLFGFLLLSIMSYHPSRYYLLMLLPLIILASSGITSVKAPDITGYLSEKKALPHNLFLFLLITGALLYAGVVTFVQFLPFGFRNHLAGILYKQLGAGNVRGVLHIILPVAALEVTLIAILILLRKGIKSIIAGPRLMSILLIVIVSLQVFQYGRWFFCHDTNLYNASKELGEQLPDNAIIAGGWSAGLVVENNLRSLVIQSFMPYNRLLIKRIVSNQAIPLNLLENGARKTIYSSDIPLYIALCRNVVFENSIVENYAEHLKPENFFKKVHLGYFTIEIYKMNKKKENSIDIIDALYRKYL